MATDNIQVGIDIDSAQGVAAIKKLATLIDDKLKDVELQLNINAAQATKTVDAVGKKIAASAKAVNIPVTVDATQATKGLRNAKGQFVKAGGDLGAAAGANAGSAFTTILGASFVGNQLSKVFSSVTQQFSEGFTNATEFETGLQSLSAITGLTGAGLDDLGVRARALATEFGGTAKNQLESFQGILSRFGPDLASTPDALAKVSESINVLSKASGLDAAQSMDVLTNSMLQFGVNTKDPAALAAESARFINVLAASAKVGAAEIPQVGEAILAVGVTARGAGISFEETNAALQSLAIGGKVGAEAGNGLRNVMGFLTKQSKQGESALNKVGLSTKELGKILTTQGLAAALEKLNEGFGRAGTAADKLKLSQQLFGKENAASAGILLQNVDLMREFTVGVTGTNEAYSQAAKNQNTFAERIAVLGAVIQDKLISVFQVLTGAFNVVFDNISTFAPLIVGATIAVAAYALTIHGATIATKLATVATKLFAAAAAGNGIGLIVAGAAIAVAGLIALANHLNVTAGEALEAAEAERTYTQSQFDSNVQKGVSEAKTRALALRFKELATNTKRTAVEETELKDIQKKLDDQYPTLISQTATFGQNLAGVEEIAKRSTTAIDGIKKANEGLLKEMRILDKEISAQKLNVAVDALRGSFSAGLGDTIIDAVNKGFGGSESGLKQARDLVEEVNAQFERVLFSAGRTPAQIEAAETEMLKFIASVSKGLGSQLATSIKLKVRDAAAASLATYRVMKNIIETPIATGEVIPPPDAGEDDVDKDKDKKTRQEELLAIYKQQADEIKSLHDVLRNVVKAEVIRGETTEANAKLRFEEIDFAEATRLFEATKKTLQIVSDKNKFFLSTGIILEKGETDTQLQVIQADIALRLAKQPIVAAVQLVVPPELGVEQLFDEAAMAKAGERAASAAMEAYIETQNTFGNRALKGLSQTFVDAFGNLNFSELILPDKETKEVEEKLNKINDKLKSGATTYQSAVKEIGEQVTETISFLDKLRDALSKSFVASATGALDSSEAAFAKERELKEERNVLENKTFDTIEARNKALAENQEAQNEAQKKGFADLGVAAGSTLGAMIVGAEGAGEAVKKLAVDLAGAMLNVYIAPLIAGFLTFLGPFALPAALAAVGVVKAIFAQAISGFKSGGYTGDGDPNAIAGVVHKREWVANASVYARNKDLFDYIGKGGDVSTFNGTHNASNVNVSPITNALDKMHATLVDVRTRLERVPDLATHKQAMQLDVTLDTYLLQQDMRRVAIRKMR